MIERRSFLHGAGAVLLAIAAGAAGPARAAAPMRFTDAAFDAAQAEGKPILVAVAAPWCPICRTQKPILAKLSEMPRFKDLQIFEIDFDTEKTLLRRFDARSQSTLIAFKGRNEAGRSVGETQPEWIEALVEKAL